MVEDAFGIIDAADLAGFKNHYMVDYLCRTGIVQPSKNSAPGRGGRRLYSFHDLVLLRAVNSLLSRGLSVSRLKKAQQEFLRLHKDAEPSEILTKYLVTDGDRVLYEENSSRVIELTGNGQLAFAFVLDLARIHSEVSEKVDGFVPKRRRRQRR
ncbi:MAG: MerR family transcriptional regulator [Alphaproteobacteria bacterium]|nr:MerR family transcriptional regulator [Alphaproteobacteria bacterium]